MRNFFHLVQACVSELQLRSLMCTAVTAIAAAIIYYLIRKDGETDADPGKASASEDSSSPCGVPQDQDMVPAASCFAAEMDQNEADKYQEAQLENEKLWKYVETLRDTIHYMKILIHETQNKHNQERERDQKAHNTLQLMHEEMTKKIKQLSSSLDQVEEQHEKALKSFDLLHLEMSSLMKDVEILKGRIQDMESQICKTKKKQDEVEDDLKYQEAQLEIENLKKYVETLRGTIQDMQIFMYETQNKHNQISKNEPQLKYQEPQVENENLKKYVETLRGTIQDMQILMYDTENKHNQEQEREQKAHKALQLKHEETIKKLQHCEELLSECERERVAYQNLTMKFSNSKESLTDIKALIKISLGQVLEKHQKAMESFNNLQFEESSLMKDVDLLKGTVQDMGSLINETQKEQDEEYERVFQAYSNLLLEQQQMKKSLSSCESLLKECKTEHRPHYFLRIEHNRMKTLDQTEELMKVALAEVMGKHRKAVKSVAQLGCSLTDKTESLQEKVQKMESLIAESQKKHDEEFDQEQEAHNIVQSVVEKLEKLHHCEEL
ncbi:cilia- and flagella-associated protein 58-like [Silurus meridionalis]|uniref:Uncharacterized protein n=1 Tax=Silurus meridionalis TaxID=175797 RepID=A0A8T0AZ85_SILME|nr:cilia- and flagella-associated protein 58-like [Silurus meridionalis]KAF7697162.1 hypothetical protein HF521_005580 [Silurus meridionalis]KAI5096688.1 hypothetical protein C0J45_13582 [Silurus meridionalis]